MRTITDSLGIGFDRSTSGSNNVNQYFSPLREQYNDITTCPEKYLLWFHHVNWDHKMQSGRTLWNEMCHLYYSGTTYVDQVVETWASLKNEIDPEIHKHVTDKLKKHQKDAKIWRDTCLEYFQQFSQMEIVEE